MFAAAVFDLDGVLIDSEPFWRRAEMTVLQRLGVPLSEDGCRETMGLRIDKVVALWFSRFPWTGTGVHEVAAEIMGAVTDMVRAEGRPMPGAVEALELFRSLNVPIAIASSSSPALIEAAIERLRISPYIRLFHSAQHEEWGKPHPAVYQSTCRRMQVDPRCAIAFEDSPNGLESARSAGLTAVCVPEPLADRSRFGSADIMLDSLLDLREEQLREAWMKSGGAAADSGRPGAALSGGVNAGE